MDIKCSFPRCKSQSDFGYIGRDVCAKHWDQLCNADCKTEKRLLKKIGLVRLEGKVVSMVIEKESES